MQTNACACHTKYALSQRIFLGGKDQLIFQSISLALQNHHITLQPRSESHHLATKVRSTSPCSQVFQSVNHWQLENLLLAHLALDWLALQTEAAEDLRLLEHLQDAIHLGADINHVTSSDCIMNRLNTITMGLTCSV